MCVCSFPLVGGACVSPWKVEVNFRCPSEAIPPYSLRQGFSHWDPELGTQLHGALGSSHLSLPSCPGAQTQLPLWQAFNVSTEDNTQFVQQTPC